MTISEIAKRVVEDPEYQAGLVARANAGKLPEAIEMLLLESYELAGGRLPVVDRTVPGQSRTFAVVRPPAFEEVSRDA